MKIRSEDSPAYEGFHGDDLGEDAVIGHAIAILKRRMSAKGEALTSPKDSRDLATLHLSELEHEVFSIMWIDNRYRLIEYETMFRGTIDGASVHPREVVKSALTHNAAACILSHNHPSGNPEPSQADLSLTSRLKDALGIVDIRVLDHIVVGGTATVSFAERGII